jgi:hypothetical protein
MEQAPTTVSTPKLSLSESRELFRNVLDMQVADPNDQDVRIAGFADCVRANLGRPTPVGEFFDELLEKRQDFSPSHLFTRTLRGAQSKLYPHFPGYPQEAITGDYWQQGMDWIFADDFRAGSFVIDVWTRPLQSNISPRYKSLKAFISFVQEYGRLRGPLRILDIGCSQNAGLNHLASGLPFDVPSVIRPRSLEDKPSLEHSAALGGLLGRHVQLDLGVGIDLTRPEDSRPWAWSCSHNPTELLDPERVEMFNTLIMANFKNVKFFRGDATDFDHDRFERQFSGQTRFDIVNISTMLYQLTEPERQAVYKMAERYAEDFIVVQDFVKIDPSKPRQLQFRANWREEPYAYRTVVRDARDGNKRWHDMFGWRSGRCRAMQAGLGRIAVTPGSTRSMWSALDTLAQQTDQCARGRYNGVRGAAVGSATVQP